VGKRVGIALATIALASVLWLARPVPRIIYLGGPILTLDAQSRVVEALGIEGDRIGAVGSEAEVRAWAGPGARSIDLGGHALLPGFIDAHGHFPGTGIFARVVDLNSPPIGEVETIDELVQRLRRKAAETSRGDWVIGLGYDDTLLREKRHPTRADLDRVSLEQAVVAIHISGHLAAVNSVALARLGIDANTPDPAGGRIRRAFGTGEPTGVLEENAAERVLHELQTPSPLAGLAIVREGVRRYVAAGVTTAQSGYADRSQLERLDLLSRIGIVPIRLVLWPSMDVVDEMLAGRFSFRPHDERWVRLGAVKLVADGSIQGYTGYLSAPYFVPPGDDPSYRGYPRMPHDELGERVSRYHRAGLQVAVHGNGDAAIDDILDAFERAQTEHPRADARPVLVHAQMARADQLDRMARLGVIPSFFSLHTYYWGDRHRELFMGPERAAHMSPAASALARGIRFTIHCDSPIVPMEPLRLVWAAVNRRSASGAEIGPQERIPVMDALRAVTANAAFQHFAEASQGSLEPGKLADLVIVSRSPLADPEHIDTLEVLETIVGGHSVYRRP